MPSLPAIGDYEQHVDLSEPYRKITPQATPGNVGGTLEHLGSAISTILANKQAAADAKDKADGAVYAANQMATTRTDTDAFMDSTKQSAPADGSGFTQTVLDQYDKRAKATLDAASTNPFAAPVLKQHLDLYRNEVAAKAMAFEAQTGVQYRSNSVKSNVDALVPSVEADPTQWQQAGAEQMHAIQNSGLPPAERLPLAQYLDSTLTTAAATGLARRDPQGVLDDINAPAASNPIIAALRPKDRETIRSFANGQLTQQTGDSVVNTFRQAGPEAGGQAYAAIDKSSLTDAQKDAVRQHVDQGLTALNAQRRTQYADQITALDTDIASGSPSPAARSNAAALYQNYALNQQQYAAALTGVERSEKDARKQSDLLQYGIGAFSKMRPLDPKNSEDGKAANLVFGHITTGAAPGSDAYANAANAVVDHVGVVPQDVVSWARASLTGGNAKDAAAAANLLSRLQQTNPRAYGFAVSDEKTRAMIANINGPVQAGADPQATVNLARTNASLPKAETDALNARWKAAAAAAGQPGALTSILSSDPAYKPGWFTSVPKPPPLMQGQFDQLTQSYFKQTNGDITQARQLAAQDLKHTWGVSEINGTRELMQYAPEAMFPGLSAAVVREDLAKTVQDNAETFQKADPAKVRLTATDRTARTAGQDWALSVPDQFGAYDVVRGKDGNPLTYRLPVSGNDYTAVRARQAQADIENAKKTRELLQELRQPGYNEPVL